MRRSLRGLQRRPVLAAAAVATVGAVFPTVTLAVPLRPPPVAVTVYGPPVVFPAVKRPAALIVPPPLTVHVNVGCDASATPN